MITSIPSSDPVEREQISGWLLVFVVIQSLQWIGVIRGLMAAPASFTLAEERHLQAAVPAYLAFRLFDIASLLVEAVVPVVGLFWLFRRSGRARILFKVYLAFLIVAGVIRSAALPVLYPAIADAFRTVGESLAPLDAARNRSVFGGLRNAGLAGVWLAYWLRSKKVARIFAREVQPDPGVEFGLRLRQSPNALMPDTLQDPPAQGRLAIRMTKLCGVPVTAVARINVVWVGTVRGFSLIVMIIPLAFSGPQETLWITLACALALQGLAWVGLRHLGGPLRLGHAGGVAAVSGSTLYVAATNWITGRPTKMLGSWPRDAVVLRRVSRIGLRRLLTVKFPGTNAPARLEIAGRRKDDTIAALFGPLRNGSLAARA